jgi:hypothetical protein
VAAATYKRIVGYVVGAVANDVAAVVTLNHRMRPWLHMGRQYW